ncbi:MAG: hypothetical protein L0Y72_09970 [Gemmataceae bacterium]|nr:hypothetical protein [Gemmataceae bacterium]MCI0739359.1 hypothetical protein [Gemmataceae bacterium]
MRVPAVAFLRVHLELIATLDYAFRELPATLGKKPAKAKVSARFQEFNRKTVG